MSQAQELKDKYEADLAALQEICKHENTTWAAECWAPAHFSGWEVRVCENCWKTLERNEISDVSSKKFISTYNHNEDTKW